MGAYAGNWRGISVYPQYARLRTMQAGRAFRDAMLEDGEIESDLGKLANMGGSNQSGCQHRKCMIVEMG